MIDECPWEIEHNGHFAWFQRSLLIGDFAPRLVPLTRFVVYTDGRAADPRTEATCETCSDVPTTNELIAVEAATGDSHFLAPYRAGLAKWPKPTDPTNCWWCNTKRRGAATTPPLCEQCQKYLAGRKA